MSKASVYLVKMYLKKRANIDIATVQYIMQLFGWLLSDI